MTKDFKNFSILMRDLILIPIKAEFNLVIIECPSNGILTYIVRSHIPVSLLSLEHEMWQLIANRALPGATHIVTSGPPLLSG